MRCQTSSCAGEVVAMLQPSPRCLAGTTEATGVGGGRAHHPPRRDRTPGGPPDGTVAAGAAAVDARDVPRRAPPETTGFRRARRPGLIARTVPITASVRGYRPPTGLRDVLAGVTVAALALPAAMGFAEVAGLSPINGLYGLLLPAVAYAVLGSSRRLIVGPEGTLAAMVAVVTVGGSAAGSGASNAAVAATLALLVAAAFVLARLLRLAWMADYLSRPVLIGYIHGVAVVLIIGQLGRLLGVDVPAQAPLPAL